MTTQYVQAAEKTLPLPGNGVFFLCGLQDEKTVTRTFSPAPGQPEQQDDEDVLYEIGGNTLDGHENSAPLGLIANTFAEGMNNHLQSPQNLSLGIRPAEPEETANSLPLSTRAGQTQPNPASPVTARKRGQSTDLAEAELFPSSAWDRKYRETAVNGLSFKQWVNADTGLSLSLQTSLTIKPSS